MFQSDNNSLMSQFQSAIPFFLFFLLLYSILAFTHPPTATHLDAADPLIVLLFPFGGTGSVVLLSLLLLMPWFFVRKTTEKSLEVAGGYALAGSVVALLIIAALRIIVGPQLPAFIPPEESAAPGLLLGLGAGIVEEALFRLAILPMLFVSLCRHMRFLSAAIVASLITGLLFAVLHEIGPGALEWDMQHFLTRFLVPGFIMSLAGLLIHPSFIVSAHCAAHVGIAWAFTGA